MNRHEATDRATVFRDFFREHVANHDLVAELPEDHPVQAAIIAADDAIGVLLERLAAWEQS